MCGPQAAQTKDSFPWRMASKAGLARVREVGDPSCCRVPEWGAGVARRGSAHGPLLATHTLASNQENAGLSCPEGRLGLCWKTLATRSPGRVAPPTARGQQAVCICLGASRVCSSRTNSMPLPSPQPQGENSAWLLGTPVGLRTAARAQPTVTPLAARAPSFPSLPASVGAGGQPQECRAAWLPQALLREGVHRNQHPLSPQGCLTRGLWVPTPPAAFEGVTEARQAPPKTLSNSAAKPKSHFPQHCPAQGLRADSWVRQGPKQIAPTLEPKRPTHSASKSEVPTRQDPSLGFPGRASCFAPASELADTLSAQKC